MHIASPLFSDSLPCILSNVLGAVHANQTFRRRLRTIGLMAISSRSAGKTLGVSLRRVSGFSLRNSKASIIGYQVKFYLQLRSSKRRTKMNLPKKMTKAEGVVGISLTE